MSASLVGSEMCIRDSSSPCCIRPPLRSASSLVLVILASRIAQIADWRICLLYTSDAADDM
eukprot:3970969-Alexandrium_andersonii.AAC.1